MSYSHRWNIILCVCVCFFHFGKAVFKDRFPHDIQYSTKKKKKKHVRKLGLDKKLLNGLINILLFTRKGAYGTSAFLCLLWLVGSYD